MQLTRNISFEEMTLTGHRKYLEKNRMEGERLIGTLKATAKMLQRVRNNWDEPLIIHSGFRGKALNRVIGGSRLSQHCLAEAADFHIIGVEHKEVFEWIWKESGLKFGQLILEGFVADKPSWIHLSLGSPFRSASKSGQVMTWSKSEGYKVLDRGVNHPTTS